MRRSSGGIGSGGMSGSVQTQSQILRKTGDRIWHMCYSGSVNTKGLTFTLRHAEPIQNLDVIHSDVPPALRIHQTFNHHLKPCANNKLFPKLQDRRKLTGYLIHNKGERGINSGLPGRVCRSVGQGLDLPSIDCLGDR